MTEESAELLDADLLKDPEATSQRPTLAPVLDELKTTRLPPITPPPPHVQFVTTSLPPLPQSFPPPGRMPSVPDMSPRPRQEAPRPTRPSWLRSLLTTTLTPPGTGLDPQAQRHLARRNAGLVCVAFAFVLGVLALVAGLRGAPDDPSMASSVVAALVIARALVAVGAGAFSFGLLRMAERLLSQH
jgi:hypothetical protein